MVSISVIVPVFKGGEAFLECLRSLGKSVTAVDEFIVVIDGETDPMWRKEARHVTRVLVNIPRKGPAAARNVGARTATGDVLLFIDADVVVQPSTIERVRESFTDEPDIAAVFGSYDDEPVAATFLSKYRNLLHHYTHQRALEDAVTFWGACGAIRRHVFAEVGGFDERYEKPCVEDIELGYRLSNAGHRIRLRKDLQVKHLKKWSAIEMVRTDVMSRALPWTELLLSYRAFRNDLNLRLENRFSTLVLFGAVSVALLSIAMPGLLPVVGLLAFALVVVNAPFYRLLMRKHGAWFALRAIPVHWLFYACSGIGFVLGIARYVTRGRLSQMDPPEPDHKSTSETADVSTVATWAEATV